MRHAARPLALCCLLVACGKGSDPVAKDTAGSDRALEGPFTGLRVSASRDLTGDGQPDLVVSSPGLDGTGAVRILSASVTGTVGADAALATLRGGSQGDIGEGLAACGDLDGDGNADLAVGLPSGDGGRGGVWLLHGPLTGSSDVGAGYQVRGTETGIDLGYAVDCGGDIDGDADADLLFAAPQADGFGIAEVTGAIYFHASDGRVTQAVANFSSTHGYETLGYHRAVSLAGDLDGDGLADTVIGGPGSSRVHLVFSPITGTHDANETGTQLDGREDDDAFGHAVAVGDLNGDGYVDVAAGAPWYGPQSGAIGIVDGPFAPDGVDVNVHDVGRWIDGQDPRALTGFSLAFADDLDGDGLGDLVAGAPGVTTSGPEAGAVYVIPGPADLPGVFAAPTVLVGLTPFAQFGHSVAVVPDANGDGSNELLIGAPYRDDGDRLGAGAAFLFHSPLPARVEDAGATATLLF